MGGGGSKQENPQAPLWARQWLNARTTLGEAACQPDYVRVFSKRTPVRDDLQCGMSNNCSRRQTTEDCQCACTYYGGDQSKLDNIDRLDKEEEDNIRNDNASLQEAQSTAAEAENAARTAATARAQADAAANNLDENATTTAARNARNAANSAKSASDRCFQATGRIKDPNKFKSGFEFFKKASAVAGEAEGNAVAAEAARVRVVAAIAAARAAAEKAAAEAAARARAKADAKAAWDAAQVAANNALGAWEKQKAEYAAATSAIPPLKLVYDNAQMVVDNTKAKKAAYEDALAQQTAANALIKTATDALSKANSKAKENLEKTFAGDATFIKNANSFDANTAFEVNKEYNTMNADWTAYGSAKTDLSKVDASKLSDVTAATDKMLDAYTKFGGSKGTYSAAVINAMKTNTKDTEYLKTAKSDVDSYGIVYGLSKEYTTMADAWAKVVASIGASDAAGIIINYLAYLPTKTAFGNALLIAQNKRAEADFQAKLAAGKDAAAKWANSSAKGCRNILTNASTEQNMLDQDITCNDTEFISGYTKVSGFDAAPVDPKVTRDNISQYLAVKYSCCTAPSGAKGPQGKKGLPGLEGVPGLIGPAGPEGIVGPVGKRGEQGEMGEEGGKGPRGEAGDDGQDGEIGLPGKPGKSVSVPFVKQVPGPMGPKGEMGPRGKEGPKGPDGLVIPAPARGFSELDRTVALFDVQEKINNYLRG